MSKTPGSEKMERAMRAPHVIFDLDGTLMEVPVDWGAVHEEMTGIGRDSGLIGEFKDLHEAYAWAERTTGVKERLVSAQSYHEMRGAGKAKFVRKGTMAARSRLSRGLSCSLFTLNTIDLVEALVGSWGFYPIVTVDRVSRLKPDPEGISLILKVLSMRPEDVIFIGNSDIDRNTALRAGITFIEVGELDEAWFG